MSYPSFSHLAFQRSPVADPFHLPLTPSLTPCSLVDTHHSRRLYLIPSSILIIPNAYTLHPRPYPSFPTLIPYTLIHTHHSQRLYLTPSSIPIIPNAYTLHPRPYPSFPTLNTVYRRQYPSFPTLIPFPTTAPASTFTTLALLLPLRLPTRTHGCPCSSHHLPALQTKQIQSPVLT